ncbi:MAG: hypothetical protein MUE81_06765, partial [Thermoflexibacter sp.]|nr:hypothetical protein [Thermoflexibacter sp.]
FLWGLESCKNSVYFGFSTTYKMDTIFTTLLSPLTDFFKDSGANIDKKAGSTKLFFEDFFQKIVFAFQNNISSLRSLI